MLSFSAFDLVRIAITSLMLGGILGIALMHNYLYEWQKWVQRKTKLKHKNHHTEKAVANVKYYAERESLRCEEHRVITKDGYVLYLQRISKPKSPQQQQQHQQEQLHPQQSEEDLVRHPVIIQHGLFMSSGVFVTNEENSLAFYLLEKGFDVWLGNNRGVAREHATLSPASAEFWDWSVDHLGKYDVPAIIDYVLKETGHEKVTWIGHSQGNGQAFMALSSNPDLSSKVKLMIALAPTARLGDLPSEPLKALRKDFMFDVFFGEKQFIPMINMVLEYAPAEAFSLLGYNMFYYLFKWSDTRWILSRKHKYFQFTGLPVSCKQIRHWMKMTAKGLIFDHETEEPYPIESIEVPLAIFHGEKDELVDADSLYQVLSSSSKVQLRHFEKIPDYEHLDLIWATDCTTKVFDKINHLILQELAKPGATTSV